MFHKEKSSEQDTSLYWICLPVAKPSVPISSGLVLPELVGTIIKIIISEQ